MEHGPPPAILHVVLVAGVVVAGLVYLVVARVKGRRRSDRDPGDDRSPDASDRSREP